VANNFKALATGSSSFNSANLTQLLKKRCEVAHSGDVKCITAARAALPRSPFSIEATGTPVDVLLDAASADEQLFFSRLFYCAWRLLSLKTLVLLQVFFTEFYR
jgi:hypothetical protein